MTGEMLYQRYLGILLPIATSRQIGSQLMTGFDERGDVRLSMRFSDLGTYRCIFPKCALVSSPRSANIRFESLARFCVTGQAVRAARWRSRLRWNATSLQHACVDVLVSCCGPALKNYARRLRLLVFCFARMGATSGAPSGASRAGQLSIRRWRKFAATFGLLM
jgi:hypothetical protein